MSPLSPVQDASYSPPSMAGLRAWQPLPPPALSPQLRLPLQTARLTLRNFAPSDLKDWHLCMSDPRATRFMYYPPMSLEQTRDYLQELIEAQHAHPRASWELAVVRTEDQRFLGACDLTLDEEGQGDLGYIFAPHAWGQGYATEAARCMVAQGFQSLGLKRIYGMCPTVHTASARVLEKAGLVREARLPRRLARQEPWDMLLFSRTRDSWLKSRPHRP